MTADPLLEAHGLAKGYGRRTVLERIDLSVHAGETVGISGANGSGKTTLLRLLAGVLRPDRGHVRRSGAMGYAPQAPLLYDQLSAWEHFRYFAAARGLADEAWRDRASRLLEVYRFEPWRDAPVATLSEGTRQKLNLSLGLVADPELLLLDEPYGGFEWETYLRFWEYVAELRDRRRAIVVVSHLFYDRTHFDRVLELRDGTLIEESDG